MAFAPIQTRRSFCEAALMFAALPWALKTDAAEDSAGLPKEVAGIAIPQSRVAINAAVLARRTCPGFLFNHCMRTFLFGALAIKKLKLTYNADEAFVAAALHDLGLVSTFSSKSQSFEIDGADAAEKFARDNGLNSAEADIVWRSIVFHDGRFPLTRRAGPEAMLVAIGAGSDVIDPGLSTDEEKRQLAEIVAASLAVQKELYWIWSSPLTSVPSLMF